MTKRVQTNLLISLFSILFCAIIGFSTFAMEEPVELKYKLKAGDMLTYKTQIEVTAKLSTTMGVQEGHTKSETNSTFTVTQIADDGTITGLIIAHVQVLESLMDGKDMTESVNDLMKQSGMQYQLEILKMQSNGRHLSILPQDAENNLTGWIVLPEKPIQIGDSWTQEVSNQMLITPDPELDFMLCRKNHRGAV